MRLTKQREDEIRARHNAMRPYDKSWNDEKFLIAEIDALRAERDELRGAAEFAEMTISHAIALGYCGEGSTKGMCEDAISKIESALKRAGDFLDSFEHHRESGISYLIRAIGKGDVDQMDIP